jgi:predicted glutamine amidotransferase
MLAKVAVQPRSAAYELLEAPHSLQQQSRCGRQPDAPDTCGPHASGCGLAWREHGQLRIEKRGPEDRWDASFGQLVRSVKSVALIAHNRLASPGLKIDASLSHPIEGVFKDTPIAFCHNGGIRNLMESAKARATTDSRIFMEELLRVVPDLRPATIADQLGRFAEEWSYTSLSGMMLTPEALFFWRSYDQKDPRKDDFEKYYTLYQLADPEQLCVASEPLTSNPEWELLPNRTLVCVENSPSGLKMTKAAW